MEVRARRSHIEPGTQLYREEGAVFDRVGELYKHIEPVAGFTDDELRERFHKVILGAGYTESVAIGILADYFDKYMQDVPSFINMLEKYERNEFDPED